MDCFTSPMSRREDVLSTHLLSSFKNLDRPPSAWYHNLRSEIWTSPVSVSGLTPQELPCDFRIHSSIMIINMLMPVKLNSFTHLRALTVLHDRGILAHATSVTRHYSSN
jgi:hypothetical protein